jgi:hypothetical protein
MTGDTCNVWGGEGRIYWRVENVCFSVTWNIACYGVDAFA